MESFTGDKKEPLVSPTAAIEKRMVAALVPAVPAWIGSHHLTLMTLAWSAIALLSAFLAGRVSRHWLWLGSLTIALQWLTDCLDGAVGRARNQGLKRWGFYMDHFLDYIFMACVCSQYAFMTSGRTQLLFMALAPLYAALEVNAWLEYGATGKFRITYNYIGPTEVRLFFIALNGAIALGGTRWLDFALPPFMLLIAIGLIPTVYATQKRIWGMDMEAKRMEEPPR